MKKIGILIWGDPTRGGAITSELAFLSSLAKINSDCDFSVLTTHKHINNKVVKDWDKFYSFCGKETSVQLEPDFSNADQFDAIFTYPTSSNFFGGSISGTCLNVYAFLSYFTNSGKKVFIRVNDSEIKVFDYKMLIENRADNESPTSSFLANKDNIVLIEKCKSIKKMNYSNTYWFANGQKDTCDWVAETIYDRVSDDMKPCDRKIIENNTIYVNDDILFQIKENYNNYTYLDEKQVNPKQLGYIGFFDTVNTRRATALKTIFKLNNKQIPLKVFGKGTDSLNVISKHDNIDVEEGFIAGNSKEYFEFLNDKIAYLFIGKGLPESRYLGKTLYDAVVARTPIAIYKGCDRNQICFKGVDAFYFSNEDELHAIYEKLKDPAMRQKWIKAQKKLVFDKISHEPFKFSTLV